MIGKPELPTQAVTASLDWFGAQTQNGFGGRNLQILEAGGSDNNRGRDPFTNRGTKDSFWSGWSN